MPEDQALAPVADIAAADFHFDPDQEVGLREVRTWYTGVRARTDKRQVFRLFGFAGTGKTTLARHLVADVKGKVYFAAYTGKAALMLRKNGCAGARTIHSLIYKAKTARSGKTTFKLNRDGPAAGAALIVIDECSMVDEKVASDLLSFGVPILVLGDPAQLPPVNGEGYFTNAKPDIMLTRIHRQAEDNPIIRIATDVREGRDIRYGTYGDRVIVDRPGNRGPEDLLAADQVLVGRNATRAAFNARLRAYRGFEGVLPKIGDRLVCLRNDSEPGILNGELFDVSGFRPGAGPDLIGLEITSNDTPETGKLPVNVHKVFFEGNPRDVEWSALRMSQHFDYGYALTGHKSQGSQWDHVIAYDEGRIFKADARRWLYTVITRASQTLTLIR